jgi:hypothetical protein
MTLYFMEFIRCRLVEVELLLNHNQGDFNMSNISKKHTVPLGAIVKITASTGDKGNLYQVKGHTRDDSGKPRYDLVRLEPLNYTEDDFEVVLHKVSGTIGGFT